MEPEKAEIKLCKRCKQNEVTMKVRSEAICGTCYHRFANVKTVKRLETLAKDIGAAPSQTKRILIGLSYGPSSAGLVDILNDQLQGQLRKRPSPMFEPFVVHIDTTDLLPAVAQQQAAPPPSSPSSILQRYAERYQDMHFSSVPLTDALSLDTIDWAALHVAPSTDADLTPAEKLRDMLDRLPSTTSRADVVRLLVRHLLIDAALRSECRAMLLGYSTTALAELTLGETAKGRGFSLPFMVGDGSVVIKRFPTIVPAQDHQRIAGEERPNPAPTSVWVAYPNRDLFRNELIQYTRLSTPPLTELLRGDTSETAPSAVVSHKDVSIDDVISRYFAGVEKHYPAIVANVVRTTAKLERRSDEDKCCGLCGMNLDELGDERWKGEMGDDSTGDEGRLCYGCARALHG
ncbi:hypothetical protein BD289DRAFT_478263 [Coniella lustricola]|uniref:Cytoplasmic tRNA 2-thiolation protein 2 n=1 Tax=Coniella lustricola TaxID=2025994 RepID=A0A2T3AMV8_9PEZI|nr:hypothetical protein BD289DRAFT_478263 [Coniella lustricola]